MNRIMPENQPGDLSLQQPLSVIESLFLFRTLSVFCLLVFSTAVFAVEPYEGMWRGTGNYGTDGEYSVQIYVKGISRESSLLPYTSNNLNNQFAKDSIGVICIIGN